MGWVTPDKFRLTHITSPIIAATVTPMDPVSAAAAEAAGQLAVRGVRQLLASGIGRVTTSRDRSKGLKILKNLPKGPLDAFVFGEDDVTPEILAALALGGTPGLQLSTIAVQWRLGEDWLSEVGSPPGYIEVEKDGRTIRTRQDTLANYSLLNGKPHKFTFLDGQSSVVNLQVPSADTSLSLDGNTLVVVVAFIVTKGERYAPDGPDGLVLRGEADGLYYCCENQFGFLEVASIDVPTPFDPDPSNVGAKMFKVCPKVLEDYSCFHRLCEILWKGDGSMVRLIGVQKVVKELGKEFRTQMSGDGIPLLSKKHLKHVHNNPGGNPTLKMPTNEELQIRVEEAAASLPLRDRDAGLVLFSTIQEVISDFVKNIESEAARPGNVGVKANKEKDSPLIRSCIVQAAGLDATFAIFNGFAKHKLNIAVSPGFTAVYFPGLYLTAVAFPEGSEVQNVRRELKPACPFTIDLRESLPILLGLARKLAKNIFKDFVETLSSEFSRDPALALSPVTDAVVKVLSPGGRPRDALYFSDLLLYLKKHNPGHTWGEASVAGILCQLGMAFSMPPRGEGCEVQDFRCFFRVCREVWESSCLGAELVVDCGVDVSGCEVRQVVVEADEWQYEAFFLKGLDEEVLKYELTGVPWDKLDEVLDCKCFLHSYNQLPHFTYYPDPNVPIHTPCRVIGFDSASPCSSTRSPAAVFIPTRKSQAKRQVSEKKSCSIC